MGILLVLLGPLTMPANTFLARVDRSLKDQTQVIQGSPAAPVSPQDYLPTDGPAGLRFEKVKAHFERQNLLTLETLLSEARSQPDARQNLTTPEASTGPTAASAVAPGTSQTQTNRTGGKVDHAEETLTPEPWQGPVEEEPRRVVSSGMPNINLSRDYVGNFQYFDPADVLPFFEVDPKSKDKPSVRVGVPFQLPTQTPTVNPSRATYRQSQ